MFSFRTAIIESNHIRGKQSWVKFVRNAKQPELPVILLEDFGALLGLLFALFGVSMTLVTGDGIWDAFGTAMIGFLLVAIAVVLALETKSLLLGSRQPRKMCTHFRGPQGRRTRIIHLKTMHLGPEELLVAAKIASAPRKRAKKSPKGSTTPSGVSVRPSRLRGSSTSNPTLNASASGLTLITA